MIPGLGALATLRGGICNIPFRFDSQQFSTAQQVSEEIQLIGKWDRLSWIGGLYYFNLHGKDGSIAKAFTPTNQRSITGATGGLENESYAAFAQGTYALTDAFNLTVGARYTKDKRQLVTESQRLDPPFPSPGNPCLLFGASGQLPASGCQLEAETESSEPTWNVSLDWQIVPGQLLYVAHRHGYRSGGLNGRGTTLATLEPFDPESVNDYELGYKSDFHPGGQAVRFNAAVYHQDYKDIQRLNAFFLNGQLHRPGGARPGAEADRTRRRLVSGRHAPGALLRGARLRRRRRLEVRELQGLRDPGRLAYDGSVATPGDNDQTYGPGGQSVRWIGGFGVVPLRVTPGTEGANTALEKYDILLLDTTLFLPRFNNIGSQRTVLILQNLRERPVSGQIFFRQNNGLALPDHPFTIAPQASLVLDTGKLPQIGQSSGSASIAHTGGWGALAGKTVVLEPSTGFTFDTMLTTAPR